MPELVEVEVYRRLAEAVIGRQVAEVRAPDAWYLKRGLTAEALAAALVGRRFLAVRRVGKLLLLETDGQTGPEWPDRAGETGPERPTRARETGPVLGLRFGMSGTLVVDGRAGADRLQYAPGHDLARWTRFSLSFADGGDLRMHDPRRLGGVELDPDESRLGPDALSLGPAALGRALGGSRAPLKARLMDQGRLAGVGNLAADELLWRASLDPARPAGSLTPAELRRLHHHLRRTLDDLLLWGGSHTGELVPHRRPGGVCPKDGTPLRRATVGGRTTWWCPHHQS